MFVYILQSDRTGRYYTGRAVQLDNRVDEHNRGENVSTRYGIPWRLVHFVEVGTRTKAVRLEKQIKSRGATVGTDGSRMSRFLFPMS